MNQEKKGIKSVELGFSILKEISRSEKPLSITELSKLCNMPKGQLYRYLISLCKVGALEKGEDLSYSLGREILVLGALAMQKTDITVQAYPFIKQLNELLNETVALAIWVENEGPLVVEWEESKKPININVRTGSLLDLTTTAVGYIFTAFLPQEKTNNIIQNSNSKLNLDKMVNFAKKETYAYTSEYISGITAVAAPVFNYKKELIASLYIVGLTENIDISKNSRLVVELLNKANELSNNLGYTS